MNETLDTALAAHQESPPTVSRWHTQSTEVVLRRLKVPAVGLTSNEAQQRLSDYGPNQLRENMEANMQRNVPPLNWARCSVSPLAR